MSALNPANTEYGQAAQRLQAIWTSGQFQAEAFQDDYLNAIDLLNQAHMRELTAKPTAERIEAAAIALYNARYNLQMPSRMDNSWEDERDGLKAIYRKDAEACLRAAITAVWAAIDEPGGQGS